MEPVIGQRQICSYDNKKNKRKFLKPCINCNQVKTLKELRNWLQNINVYLFWTNVFLGSGFGVGGAQDYFGVFPDLSIFGKGITNGMPLGILAGKKKIYETL